MLKAAWHLVVHIVVGSVLFALMFGIAVGMEFAANWLKELAKPSEFLIGLLTAGKYVLAVFDLVMYFLFMVTMGWEFLQELWWPGHEKSTH